MTFSEVMAQHKETFFTGDYSELNQGEYQSHTVVQHQMIPQTHNGVQRNQDSSKDYIALKSHYSPPPPYNQTANTQQGTICSTQAPPIISGSSSGHSESFHSYTPTLGCNYNTTITTSTKIAEEKQSQDIPSTSRIQSDSIPAEFRYVYPFAPETNHDSFRPRSESSSSISEDEFLKKLKNNHACRMSRIRRKEQKLEMENKIRTLGDENRELREQIYSLDREIEKTKDDLLAYLRKHLL